jgi:hypothetical protein
MRSQRISDLAVKLDCCEQINISLLHSRLESLVRELRIINLSNETFNDISVSLGSPHLAERWYLDPIEELNPGGERVYSNITPSPLLFHKFPLDSPFPTRIEIYLNEQLRAHRPIEVLPVNSWDQTPGRELALASFVFYLSEEVSSVVRRAQQQPELIIPKQGFPGLPPLEAAKALYNTVKEFCPPYSLELGLVGRTNQLIRFPWQFMKDWRGTCIDFALLLAALIENVRCYPVVFILNMRNGGRHALPGFWNLRNPYAELPNRWNVTYPIPGSVITAKKTLLDLIDARVLIPLDPDTLCRHHQSFERCVEDGINLVRDNILSSMHDIESARQHHGVYPLPVSPDLLSSRPPAPPTSPAPRLPSHAFVEPGTVPQELIESLARGKCVLFIGDKLLSPDGSDGPLPSSRLAERLARGCGHGSADEGLYQVAQYYENKLGRERLVREVQESLHDPRWPPPRIYQLIARLPLELVVCFYYDSMLEAALTRHKVPFTRVFGDEQISQIAADMVTLVKLYGCAEAGEPLTLTLDDQLDLSQRKPVLSKFIKARIANRELLLLGCDLHDFTFKEMYRGATRHLRFLTHKAYAVTREDASSLHYWHREGMLTIRADAELFLNALLDALPRGAPAPLPAPPPAIVSPRPYKFLDYFNTEDEAIFFGREGEVGEFYKELLASRGVTILCGKSGDGKTSFVKAGIIPLLRREHDWLLTYTRCGVDVEQAIRQEVSAVLLEAGVQIGAAPEKLAEFLRHVGENTRREMLVVIDQFEEFFIKLGAQVQMAFFDELSKCIQDGSAACRFIIVIREDYLPNLTESAFTDRLTLLPRYLYRLPELSRAGALAAILEPARKFGLAYEPELPDSILDDLSPDTIVPAQLQIICTKLNDALGEGVLFSNELYEELGRSRRILEDHLNEALSQFNDADVENVRSILKAMVTSEATKDLLTLDQIAERAGVPAAATRQLLDYLIHQHRLVREVTGSELRYELSHECLAPAVSAWLAEEERRQREVQELLGREIANSQKFPDFIIERDKLNIIHEWSPRLILSAAARALVLSSILHHKAYDMLDGYWIGQSRLLSLEHTQTLLAFLFEHHPEVTGADGEGPLPLLARALRESKGQEILECEVASWRKSSAPSVEPRRLKFICEGASNLRLDGDARRLILSSILHHQTYDLLNDFWIKQAGELAAHDTDLLLNVVSQQLVQGAKKKASAPLRRLRETLLVNKGQDLLERASVNWLKSPDAILEPAPLKFIYGLAGKLRLSDDHRRLILSSIVHYRHYQILNDFWLGQFRRLSFPSEHMGQAVQAVQALLEGEVARWQRTGNAAVALNKLAVIHICSPQLTFSPDAAAFVLAGILHHKSYHLLDGYWLVKLRDAPARYMQRVVADVQELLESEVAKWRKPYDYTVKIERLLIFHLYAPRLTLGAEARDFILSSILRRETYYMLDDFWIEQSKLLPTEYAQSLLNFLDRRFSEPVSEFGANYLRLLQEALMVGKVQNFLQREVASNQRSPDVLIEPGLLKFIHQWSPKLEISDDARMLILSSIQRHQMYEMLDDFWIEQARALPAELARRLPDVFWEVLERRAKG